MTDFPLRYSGAFPALQNPMTHSLAACLCRAISEVALGSLHTKRRAIMNAKTLENPQKATSEPMPARYVVQTRFTFGWANCWTDDSGNPLTFATYDEAEQEMKDHITDCINAVEGGELGDSPDPDNLRVVAA